jgi:hypothetical protein
MSLGPQADGFDGLLQHRRGGWPGVSPDPNSEFIARMR